MTNMDDWLRLCALIDDDHKLVQSVRLAVSEGGDAWAALIDGLDDAGALAYLDVDDTGMELADALPQVPRIFAAGVDIDEVGDVDGDLAAAIVRADSILAPHDLRIVFLEEDSDAYPLVVVPIANVAPILDIVGRLGFTARAFS
ncbi:hypothetical protein [Microbacterium sp.]|uniref:DUF6630 family protein n=1 Tax=Microbacterium sp. TaxID=51671 RepID=UPI0026176219|nr:hypothetical protein [Microbacterium sp.]